MFYQETFHGQLFFNNNLNLSEARSYIVILDEIGTETISSHCTTTGPTISLKRHLVFDINILRQDQHEYLQYWLRQEARRYEDKF